MRTVCGRNIRPKAPVANELPLDERSCETCFRVKESEPTPLRWRWRKIRSWHMEIINAETPDG